MSPENPAVNLINEIDTSQKHNRLYLLKVLTPVSLQPQESDGSSTLDN